MKKLIALSVAAFLVAAAVWAQPSPADPPAAPKAPNAAVAPACPQAPGTGMGMRMGMGRMHGRQGDRDMPGRMGMRSHGAWGMGMRGERAGAMLLRNAKKLGLTDQQVAQLKKLQETHQLAMVDARAQAEKARIELGTLMRDKNADQQEVLQAIDAAAQARANIAKKRYLNRRECMSVLTADQQSKLQELREDRQQGRRQMRMERQDQRRDFRDSRFNSNG